MPQTIHRKSDQQVPQGLEPVENPNPTRQTDDTIIDSQAVDPPTTPNMPRKLRKKQWTDKDIEEVLRAIVAKLSTI
jgi:hypothetical protein